MSGDLCASVIIPCHRADADLPLQLEALARQIDAPPFEVLIVDNGGNDDLARIGEKADAAGLSLRVIDATDRGGAGYARNVGMGAARADALLFCDADDVVMPEWVRLGVAQLKRGPVFSGGAVPVAEALFAEGWEEIVSRVGEHEDVASPLPASGSEHYPILMGGSFGITRELALSIGGFDLSFGSSAEDNDLAFRLVRSGVRVPDAGQVCIAYRIRDESAGFRRGFRSAVGHAMLCARHDAWRSSKTYAGKWPLRPIKSILRPARRKAPGAGAGERADRLGRDVGAVVGWLRFRGGLWMPRAELGSGIDRGKGFR